MEEEKTSKQRPLNLDWEKLLAPERVNDDPPAVVIVKTTTSGGSTRPPQESAMLTDQQREEVEKMSDYDLNEAIGRRQNNLNVLGPRLPDKGEKLRAFIGQLEAERERRKLRRLERDTDGCEKPTLSTSSSTSGASDGAGQETPSQVHSQSSFALQFCRKMETKTDFRTDGAFDEELSCLNGGRQKMKSIEELSQNGRQKVRSSSRHRAFQCPSDLSLDGDNCSFSNGHKTGRSSSPCSLQCIGEHLPSCSAKKRDATRVVAADDSKRRKGRTVVLVDEEENQPIETSPEADTLAECMKEVIVYYPSRDDPEAVEICYSDLKCLAPEEYLTSTIMNFYIRYLQKPASTTNRAMCEYHFFNTYFYNKLKEAESYKGNDRNSFFVKFRRWWKGVNIFQKAYIFIPIHEDLHWSLVIICIPDKEDETGPIILHLDSLRLHRSGPIFDNIKSYMIEEWKFLNEAAPSDLPIADRIWKHLPRRIDDKKIAVPQQKNDYDCGLFVLFFIKRFIEEAPERLKKNNLAMFGKQWFKPEEASGLRVKIRKILVEEFKKARKDKIISELFPSPSEEDNAPAECIEDP